MRKAQPIYNRPIIVKNCSKKQIFPVLNLNATPTRKYIIHYLSIKNYFQFSVWLYHLNTCSLNILIRVRVSQSIHNINICIYTFAFYMRSYYTRNTYISNKVYKYNIAGQLWREK